MAVLDPVVLGLGSRRIARQAPRLSQLREALCSSGDELVRVALVPGVPEDDVVGGVEHAVDGECEFDHPEVRTEVATVFVDRADDVGAHLLGQLLELLGGEGLEVGG